MSLKNVLILYRHLTVSLHKMNKSIVTILKIHIEDKAK